MARFCPLFSGSSGNSAFVGNADEGLLVDAGVSCKRILDALAQREIEQDSIRGILITHEHSDHIKGLKVLTKRLKVPVYSSALVLDYLAEHDCIAPGCELRELAPVNELAGMRVIPFHTPHDSVDSMGFRIQTADSRVIAIATDLGVVTGEVREHILGADLVMIESNYDKGMLECGTYPYFLKQRIKGSRGHLSNDDCAGQVSELVLSGTTRVFLAHLSRENNLPQLALEHTRCTLDEMGAKENFDYLLKVAPREEPAKLEIF